MLYSHQLSCTIFQNSTVCTNVDYATLCPFPDETWNTFPVFFFVMVDSIDFYHLFCSDGLSEDSNLGYASADESFKELVMEENVTFSDPEDGVDELGTEYDVVSAIVKVFDMVDEV